MILELDPDRLQRLAERLDDDSGTVEEVHRQLTDLAVPSISKLYVARALGLTSDVDAAARDTAGVARTVMQDTTGADRSPAGPDQLPVGVLAPLDSKEPRSPWWSSSRYDPRTAWMDTFDWSSLDDPVELRSFLIDLTTKLGADAWSRIPSDVRSQLIETCPDLVVELVVQQGGEIPVADWEALLEAIACDETTESFKGEVTGRIPLDKLNLVAIGDFEFIIIERTDGTATISFATSRAGGVGLSTIDPTTVATVDGTIGERETMTFKFDSIEEAHHALDDLRNAAAGIVEKASEKPWEWLTVIVPGSTHVAAKRAFEILTADSVEETLRNYGDHLDRVEVEARFAQAAAASKKLPSFAALAASVESRFSVAYSEEVGGDDDYASVKADLDLSGSAKLKLGEAIGLANLQPTGKMDGSTSVEYRIQKDGDDRLILTFDGELTGGVKKSPGISGANPSADQPATVPWLPNGASFDVSATSGNSATVVIDIPIDDTTIDAANDLVDALAHGADPKTAAEALYDAADITVTQTDVTSVSAGVTVPVLVDSKATYKQDILDNVRRKRPYGDWHSPADLISQLEEKRPGQPSD